MDQEELNNIQWEKDPVVLIYRDQTPGKVKMHTKTLDWNDWIKIDRTYPDQMKLRHELFEEHMQEVFVTSDQESTKEAKWELFEELFRFLPDRFPQLFRLEEGYILNRVTGEKISTSKDAEEDVLIRAAKLTQEDWCVLEWNEEMGAYYLTAGVVLFPMRWSLAEKFLQPMASIHEPVKPFGKHLVDKVYSLFKAMSPQAPIWRANWAIFNDLDGPLQLFTPTGHTVRNEQNTVTRFESKAITGKKLTFRAEYQTLRKLPRSEAIIFGIRTYQRYLSDFENFSTEDVEALIEAIDTLDKDFYEYKGAEFWDKAALEYLRQVVVDKKKQKNGDKKNGLYWIGAIAGVALIGAFAVYKLKK